MMSDIASINGMNIKDKTARSDIENITGQINKINIQYKNTAKKTIVEGNKLFLTKEDGTKLDNGTQLPTSSTTTYDDSAIKADIKTLKDNEVNLLEDETSMEGIKDNEYPTLTTQDKTLIGSINEVNTQCKDIAKQTMTNEERNKLSSLKNYDDTEIKASINNKLDKNGILTMANMGQDVKEAMTGGSVAVVGKGAILTENIASKQVTPYSTNFFDIVNFMDISSITFENITINTKGLVQSKTNSCSVIFRVESNTSYKLQIKDITIDRGAVVESENNSFTVGSTYTLIKNKQPTNNLISFTTGKNANWICVYFISNNANSIEYYNKYKSNFLLYKNEIPTNTFDTIKKSYLPPDISYKADLLNYYSVYNLLNEYNYQMINGVCDVTGLVTIPDTGKSIIIDVLPNTTYFIQLPLASNRNFILSSSDKFEHNKKYSILEVTSLNNRIFSFTTSSDTKQVFIYYNNSLVDFDINEFDLVLNQLDLGKGLRLKNEYAPLSTYSFMNKKILTIGDSITAINETDSAWDRSWRKYFKEIMKPSQFSNTAVPGATWRDKDGTVYDGNPVLDGADKNVNNVIGNQIEKILRAKDTTYPNYSRVAEFDSFDVIIIACGTNDSDNAIPTDTEIETQFHNGQTPIENLSELDRKTWAGAIRYAIDQLRRLYPNAQIFLSTPIQKTGNKYQDIINKNTIIKKIGKRLSVPVIDSIECGVYDMSCPSLGKEGDYNDGLHLSPQGANKLGKYIANSIKQFI